MRILALFTLLFAFHTGLQAEVTVATDFPGGNAEIVLLDQATNTLHLRPDIRADHGWPCWWYARLDGLEPGKLFTLVVSANPKPFLGANVLNASWSQPNAAFLSADGVRWDRTSEAVMTEKHEAAYTFMPTARTVWVAWGPPFTSAHVEKLLARVEKKLAGEARRFVLATTRDGRPVHAIAVGTGPSAIWVQARQHAWEAGGSWVGAGLLEWFAGDDPQAIKFRSTHTLHFVPVMDVDSVEIGAGGKESNPRDHNRDWTTGSRYPEVVAAQQRISTLHASGKLLAFIDLHNPGPGDKQPFYFGPFDFEQMSAGQQAMYHRFLDLSIKHINGPLPINPKYRFATYVKTAEERSRMSAQWVREHTKGSIIAMTLETAWNTPHSDMDGYQTVGRQLAKTLAKYLDTIP